MIKPINTMLACKSFMQLCFYFVLGLFSSILLTSVVILFSYPGFELRFCSSFSIAFINQVCIWFVLILCPFVDFYKRLWSLNVANTLFLHLSMSSIVSSIFSPTIYVSFGVSFWTKRFWMLVSFPLFAPVCHCFQEQKGFGCWYPSRYLLLFECASYFLYICLFFCDFLWSLLSVL